ncbi:MAG: cadherin-like domain-containing protein [Anaerolineales bacterium]|nr:cadherin-like domain-containing protein [Anaerolineales bacterium]
MKRFGLLISLFWLGTAVSAAPTAADWAFPDRSYRMPVTVQANGYARADKVAELDVDFGQRLTALGEAGSFAENSVRVAEVDASGTVLDDAVPFQFDNGSAPDTATGTLVFLLTGTTAAGETRYYQVYFDTGTFSAPTFTDRVDRQSDKTWAGQSSYHIITYESNGVTKRATYYYHKEGAGFAGVIDSDGNDWVSFGPTPGSMSGGEYRGIPNLGKVFHPGYTGSAAATSGQGSNSVVLEDGPLRLTIQSTSKDGTIQGVWAIYPTYAQMTLTHVANGEKYWMLYEGTPGGELNYSSAPKDYVVSSNNTQINVDQTFNSDLNPEWVYFADGNIDRSLFVAHGPNDTEVDSFRDQDDFPSNGSELDAMTVFGFGRDQTKGITRLLSVENATYTFGLVDDRDFASVSGVINGAAQDLLITIWNDAPTVATNDGLAVDEGGTAVFTPTNLNTTDPEGGEISYTIKTTPTHGSLRLNGTPLSVNDTFTQSDIDGGALSYKHDGSETTSDTLTLSAADDVQSTSNFAVGVTVTAVNDPPTATADSATSLSGLPTIIDLVDNDNDVDSAGLTVTSLSTPAHGQVVNNGDGTVTYTANANYEGVDTFTYRASDGSLSSAQTTVTVTVSASQKVFLPLIVNP